MKKIYRLPATVCALAICLSLGFAIMAWNEPAETPPGGNAAAPINAGDAAQSKSGDLNIGAGLKYWISKIGDSFALKNDAGQVKLVMDQSGNLGLGVDAPAQKIDLGDDGTGAGGGRVVNVSLPVDDNDAVTKKYVDARGAGGYGACEGVRGMAVKFTAAEYVADNLVSVANMDQKCADEYPGYQVCRYADLCVGVLCNNFVSGEKSLNFTGCMPDPWQYDLLMGWIDRSYGDCSAMHPVNGVIFGVSSNFAGRQWVISNNKFNCQVGPLHGIYNIACCRILD